MKYRQMWESIWSKITELKVEHFCWLEYPCKWYGFVVKSTLFTFNKGILAAYYSEEDMKAAAKAACNYFLQDEKNLKEIIEKILRVENISESFLKKANSIDLSGRSYAELLKLFKQNYKNWISCQGVHYFSMPQIFWDIEKYIKKELEKAQPKVKNKKVQEQFIVLTSSIRPMRFEKTDSKTKKLFQDTKKEQKELEEKLKLNNKTLYLLRVMRKLSWYRINYTRIMWTNCAKFQQKIFKEMAKRLDLNDMDFKRLLYEEICEILEKGRISPKIEKELKERNIFFVYITHVKDREMASGKKAKELFSKHVKQKDYALMDEVKGIPANVGKVRGVAKVFKNETYDVQKCIKEMKEGEILIIQNAWPELLPLYKKAKALITNEGGMGSHAAVVAREFNIPSIAGTIIATKVFNTGDEVEVDADKGIIRKIK